MVTWGLISTAMIFVNSAAMFYLLRFLLGAAEAGFFPGILFYLTHWFPARERARTVALFMTATAMAGVIGAPLSSALLQLDGTLGLHGWQWLFIIEGLPAVLLAPVVLWRLTERPEDATWLSPEERTWLARKDGGRAGAHAGDVHHVRRRDQQRPAVGADGAVLLHRDRVLRRRLLAAADRAGDRHAELRHGGAAVCDSLRRGDHWDGDHRHPFGSHRRAAMACRGAMPDRRGGLRPHGACAVDRRRCRSLTLSIAAFGIWGTLGPFWTLPPALLRGTAAAGGIALVNSIGNLGGFVGPFVVGWVKDLTGGFTSGLLLLAAVLVFGAVVILRVKVPEAA